MGEICPSAHLRTHYYQRTQDLASCSLIGWDVRVKKRRLCVVSLEAGRRLSGAGHSSEAMKDNELSAFVLCTFLSGGGNNC